LKGERLDRLGLTERFIETVVVVVSLSIAARLVFELLRPLLPHLGLAAVILTVAGYHRLRSDPDR
jgi:hypothetical protein